MKTAFGNETEVNEASNEHQKLKTINALMNTMKIDQKYPSNHIQDDLNEGKNNGSFDVISSEEEDNIFVADNAQQQMSISQDKVNGDQIVNKEGLDKESKLIVAKKGKEIQNDWVNIDSIFFNIDLDPAEFNFKCTINTKNPCGMCYREIPENYPEGMSDCMHSFCVECSTKSFQKRTEVRCNMCHGYCKILNIKILGTTKDNPMYKETYFSTIGGTTQFAENAMEIKDCEVAIKNFKKGASNLLIPTIRLRHIKDLNFFQTDVDYALDSQYIKEIIDAYKIIMIDCSISSQCIDRVLFKSPYVMSICLNSTHIGDEGLSVISKYAGELTNLTELHLNTVGLTEKSGQPVAHIIKSCNELLILALAENNFGKGVEFIFDSLRDSKILVLSVATCHIKGESLLKLKNAMKDSFFGSRVKHLALSWNDLGEIGAKYIRKILKDNKSLKLLYLRDTKIGDNGAKLVAKGLRKNQTLEVLGIGLNFGDVGAEAFAQAFEKNKTLQILYLKNCTFTGKAVEYFANAFEKNKRGLSILGMNCVGLKEVNNKAVLRLVRICKKLGTTVWLFGNKINTQLIEYANTVNCEELPAFHF